jgi:hypothetical protein
MAVGSYGNIGEDVEIVGTYETAGDPYFKDVQTTSTPGTEQTLYTETIGAGIDVNLFAVYVICRQEGSYKVQINSDIIASGRTGAAQSNVYFRWQPFRTVEAGQTLSVKFTAMTGKPASDVECYIQGREIT